MSTLQSNDDLIAQTEQLANILDENQTRTAIDPRSVPVRFSTLKLFALSPAHYYHACQDDREETLAMRMGTAAHAAVFRDRQIVVYPGRRAGKAWEAFSEEHEAAGHVIVNDREHVVTTGIVDAIRRNGRAMDVLFGDGAITETRLDWTFAGRDCRSTPDSYSRHGTRVVDLKTSRCGEPKWFAREALKRHYHAQLVFYSHALKATTGKAPQDLLIVCVEGTPPHNVCLWRVTDEARLVGEKLIRAWWEQLLVCEQSNSYPGYADSILDLEITAWNDLFSVEDPIVED